MRIHHLTWIPDPNGYRGVEDKLCDLQHGARKAGIDLQVHVLSSSVQRPHQTVASWPGWLPGPLRRIAKSTSLMRFMRDLGPGPIILRYPGALDVGLPWLLARFGDRLVTEHHTNEIAELHALPGGRLRAGLEQLLQPAVLSRVRGCVAMTDEIAGNCRRNGLRRSALTLANGVDPERFPLLWRPWAGGRLRVLMIAGVFWPWQGLDRVLRGMLADPRHQIELHLAGTVRGQLDSDLIRRCNAAAAGSVVEHGDLRSDQIDALAANTHLALSSLALHRKGMTEACPIKSREYCARGIPFVQAYHDPDFPPGSPGCYRLPADESPIMPEQLQEFARQAAQVGNLGMRMRQHALEHLDFASKAKVLASYLQSLGSFA